MLVYRTWLIVATGPTVPRDCLHTCTQHCTVASRVCRHEGRKEHTPSRFRFQESLNSLRPSVTVPCHRPRRRVLNWRPSYRPTRHRYGRQRERREHRLYLPLTAACWSGVQEDYLLTTLHADVNASGVMSYGFPHGSTVVIRLLLDAGGCWWT